MKVMNESILKSELDNIIDAAKRACGKDISLYERSFLLKTINKRMASVSASTFEDFAMLISKNPQEAEGFFQSLNINYSEFFRNPLTFAVLEQLVLPSVFGEKQKTGKNQIRIWSAGCAAGQEAYSVAILMDEFQKMKRHSFSYHIFATDISEDALALAQKGSYDFKTVQNVPLKHISNYFDFHDNEYNISQKLKEKIDFSFYDLLDDKTTCPPISIYGEFDLILCSNILFYYRPDVRHTILDKISACLPCGGYLVTGEAENSIVRQTKLFSPVSYSASVFIKTKKCS
jgi:chemotaxis protein methyltransferase CheR